MFWNVKLEYKMQLCNFCSGLFGYVRCFKYYWINFYDVGLFEIDYLMFVFEQMN